MMLMKVRAYLVVFLTAFLFVTPAKLLAAPVNVNTASAEEISDSLKGIGPTKAEAIFAYCKEYKCEKADDLLNVKGIGDKTLQKIAEDLIFE